MDTVAGNVSRERKAKSSREVEIGCKSIVELSENESIGIPYTVFVLTVY